MLSGEKTREYREAGGKIAQQVENQPACEYDTIKFVNGYGRHRPWFSCDFYGYEYLTQGEEHTYSNGLTVTLPAGTLAILLGPIRASGNLDLLAKALRNSKRKGKSKGIHLANLPTP